LWIASKAAEEDVQLANEIATDMTKVYLLFDEEYALIIFSYSTITQCKSLKKERSQITSSGTPWEERKHMKRLVYK
jgi:hypothetical protein